MKKNIIIGTRGSQLALIQTALIKNLLQPLLTNGIIETKIIKTTGDSNKNPIPLDTIGKGWFTKEIDRQLLEEKIDIAVHSLKDLPETLPDGLAITAIPKREDASEALVAKNNLELDQLPKGAIVGTDSTRRRVQIIQRRTDIIVQSVRGNVNSRLEKLEQGEYDGLFLAVAGIKRLGKESSITQYFDPTDFIPSPGQGALAIVSKQSNKELTQLLSQLNHDPSVTAVTAERAFSKAMGGGCKMPVGAYAICEGKTLTLHGMVGSLDGKQIAKDTISGDKMKPVALAEILASRLLKRTNWYRIEKI